MIQYPAISPIIVQLGPFAVRWYGMMYLMGATIGFLILRPILRKQNWSVDLQLTLALYVMAGVLIGGRLGYVLVYDLSYYFTHPTEWMAYWNGGMSFHGGAVGALISIWIFHKRHRAAASFWYLADLMAWMSTIGIALGRIGNFINGELYGRVTTIPWGMVFPGGGPEPRHPSQLYEACFEGLVLFALLSILRFLPFFQINGRLLAVFMIGYGGFRFVIEYFREPDAQLGTLLFGLSMGQWLCILTILLGIGLLSILKKSPMLKNRKPIS